jgi:hypothetical protein
VTAGRRRHALGAVAVVAGMAAILAAMGRTWWCAAGDTNLWSSEVWSRHNSQHLVDPYTFTHVLHGLVFYALVWLAVGGRVGAVARWWLGFAIEVAWEVLENTDALIERYRGTTVSLDYFGDSVVNSIGDVLAYVAGYWLAGVVPVWASVATFVVVDLALVAWIRDSLVLNVVMLLFPIEALREWQSRGHGA